MNAGKPQFDPENPIVRFRSKGLLKHRIARIAERRGCDPTTVLREGMMEFSTKEEKRLELLPIEQELGESNTQTDL